MVFRSFALTAVFAAALTVQASSARADEAVRRIGVVVTVRVNISADEAARISAGIGDALRKERPVDVIAGRESERRLPPAGLPSECVAQLECRIDLGRRLDAEELLMLVIVKMGERIQIDSTWASVASGKTASRPAIVLEGKVDRASIFARAVPTLIPHIKKPEKKQANIVIIPGTTRAGSGRHFTRGTWIATGISAAALLTAGVFALSAQRKFSSLEERDCRVMPCPRDEIDGLRNHARLADVFFGVGLAAGVTAVVLYARSGGKAEKSTGPQLQVSGAANSFALGLGGRF